MGKIEPNKQKYSCKQKMINLQTFSVQINTVAQNKCFERVTSQNLMYPIELVLSEVNFSMYSKSVSFGATMS